MFRSARPDSRGYRNARKPGAQGPKANANGPKANANGPKANANGPKQEANGPRASMSGPKASTNGPRAHAYGSRPAPRSSKPAPYTKKPEAHASKPVAKAERPAPHAGKPVAKAQRPAPRVEQAVAPMDGPAADVATIAPATNEPASGPAFADMGLSKPIADVLRARGYNTPTPIQAMAIPVVLEGRDVFGCAQTGTGKTAAFALPVLHDLAEAGHIDGTKFGARGRPPRALVLAPTRELAMQIFDAFVAYGRNLPLRFAAVFGGVGQYHQEKALRGGIDALIATPGRLMDLHEQGLIDLGSVEVLVLDEADRMLDMGFLPEMKRIAALTPDSRQTLLFSATASKAIRALANGLLKDPAHLEAQRESSTVEAIDQRVYMVRRDNKTPLLQTVLAKEGVGRTLVFTRTKHGADKLVKQLERGGVRAAAIHGNKTQNARTRALEDFKRSHKGVLVATDVASRGIDVSNITHVINYDLPGDAETYVHRIGRTARAGASGVAITFCDAGDFQEHRELMDIERRTGASLTTAMDAGDLCHERPAVPQRGKPGHDRNNANQPHAGANRRSASNPGRRGGPPRRGNGPTHRGNGPARQTGAARA
ncbi:MAG: DEAD/DEAH box helicase [Phycisphaeraceae bacterium]|nr:DEAD/DEAH box helicase [Phycisphaeraceae bacterium]